MLGICKFVCSIRTILYQRRMVCKFVPIDVRWSYLKWTTGIYLCKIVLISVILLVFDGLCEYKILMFNYLTYHVSQSHWRKLNRVSWRDRSDSGTRVE